jgi:hypothetical protein
MTLRRAFVFLFVADVFGMAARETLDPDMWWHLRTGKLIWESGIPRRDVFSFTMLGHDWFAHEWLSEAVMWPVYRLGGLGGLSIGFAALVALAFWLVYRCCDGQPYLAAAVALLGAFTAAPAFGVRPQMFNILLLAAFLAIIEGVRGGRLTRRALFLLPVLTVGWANLHSGYLLGIVLLLAYAAADGAQQVFGDPDARTFNRADAQRLALLAVACFAAAVLNPHGWHLWSYPFGTLGSAAMQENIAEWRSPDFHLSIYWPFAIMMALGNIAWVLRRSRPSWADVLLFLSTATAGLVSTRHIPLFAVVATPIITRSLSSYLEGSEAYAGLTSQRVQRPPNRRESVMNWTLLLIGVLTAAVWTNGKLARNDAAIAKAFPVGAVDYLEREGLASKRGYNSYVWGGYLIWRGVPVFVDGRADVYEGFLSDYLKTFRLTNEWRKPLEDFDVIYVLVERSNPLGTLLTASGQWREAYADDVSRVFVKSER